MASYDLRLFQENEEAESVEPKHFWKDMQKKALSPRKTPSKVRNWGFHFCCGWFSLCFSTFPLFLEGLFVVVCF